MANREVTEYGVKDWVKFGHEVVKFKNKLNRRGDIDNKLQNSDIFYIIFYDIAKPTFDIDIAKRDYIPNLKKALGNLGSGYEGSTLRDFISETETACYSQQNLSKFIQILRANNLVPIDEVKAQQEQERRRQQQQQQEAERRRQQQQQEEAERRRQELERLRRQQEQQEAERIRQQQEKEKRIKRIGKIVLFVIAFIALATFNNYRKDKKEYRKLVTQSEKYVKQQQYQKATESLIKIKQITNNKKMVADANARLDKINYEKEKISKTLREEINTVWESYFIKKDGVISTTLDKNIMKYINKKEMPPIIESISQKTEKLKNATDNQKEYNDNIKRLNILIKYYNYNAQ